MRELEKVENFIISCIGKVEGLRKRKSYEIYRLFNDKGIHSDKCSFDKVRLAFNYTRLVLLEEEYTRIEHEISALKNKINSIKNGTEKPQPKIVKIDLTEIKSMNTLISTLMRANYLGPIESDHTDGILTITLTDTADDGAIKMLELDLQFAEDKKKKIELDAANYAKVI